MPSMFFLKGDHVTQFKGTWWIKNSSDGICIVVAIKCPNGHISTLWSYYGNAPSDHHAIAENGTVTPSVVCPREACGFHQHIVLKDWESNALE